MIVQPIIQAVDLKMLKSLENEKILDLGSLFPYGLNDRHEKPKYLYSEVEFNRGLTPIYSLFPKAYCSKKNKRSNRAKRNKPKPNNIYMADDTLQIILDDIYTKQNLIHKNIVTYVNRLKKNYCLKLGQMAEDTIKSSSKIQRIFLKMTIDQCTI